MKKQEVAKRYVLFVVSLFFIGLGIALTKHGNIGISPISSVTNVVSLRYTFLSFGTWVIVSNCVYLLGLILILRRRFQPIQLLQLPLSFLFGYFTDAGIWITQFLPNDTYIVKLLLVIGGSAVLGFGIALSVIADVILNAAEGFVKALADTIKKEFGSVKILVDICLVVLSVGLSMLFFEGKLVGIREGTILSAVLVGRIVNVFLRLLQKPRTGRK